ncbi:DUF6113 family protein [Mycetocola tolaasinivorans]|uniref:DUF6113 family protein n=1 Tax=Mycetocola tolaasinivorans TaxID=76635 RepID=UPI0011C42059|nr:DUF6113 family protein [Mycetocola tolaasinivorans]
MTNPADFPATPRTTPSGTAETAFGVGFPAAGSAAESTEKPRVASRIPSLILAFLAGALMGMVGTVAHPNTVTVAGIDVPYGLLLGLAASLALMLGVRLVSPGRAAVIATGIGLIGVIALFTVPGTGGTILIDNSTNSLVWTLGPVLIATIVIAWPRFSKPVRPVSGAAPGHPGQPG